MCGLISCSKHFITVGVNATELQPFRQAKTGFSAIGTMVDIFEASGYGGVTEGDVKNIIQDMCQLTSAVPEHMSWDVIWTCSFPWVDPGQGPLVSAALMITAGPADNGGEPTFPLYVRFDAWKHAKKLLNLSGREASSLLTPSMGL